MICEIKWSLTWLCRFPWSWSAFSHVVPLETWWLQGSFGSAHESSKVSKVLERKANCRRHTWKENVWPITQYVYRMFSSFPCPTCRSWRYLEHSAKRWHCTILWQSFILFQPSVPECQVSRHFVSFCIEHVDGWHKSVKILMKADRLPRAHFHSSTWDLWGPRAQMLGRTMPGGLSMTHTSLLQDCGSARKFQPSEPSMNR